MGLGPGKSQVCRQTGLLHLQGGSCAGAIVRRGVLEEADSCLLGRDVDGPAASSCGAAGPAELPRQVGSLVGILAGRVESAVERWADVSRHFPANCGNVDVALTAEDIFDLERGNILRNDAETGTFQLSPSMMGQSGAVVLPMQVNVISNTSARDLYVNQCTPDELEVLDGTFSMRVMEMLRMFGTPIVKTTVWQTPMYRIYLRMTGGSYVQGLFMVSTNTPYDLNIKVALVERARATRNYLARVRDNSALGRAMQQRAYDTQHDERQREQHSHSRLGAYGRHDSAVAADIASGLPTYEDSISATDAVPPVQRMGATAQSAEQAPAQPPVWDGGDLAQRGTVVAAVTPVDEAVAGQAVLEEALRYTRRTPQEAAVVAAEISAILQPVVARTVRTQQACVSVANVQQAAANARAAVQDQVQQQGGSASNVLRVPVVLQPTQLLLTAQTIDGFIATEYETLNVVSMERINLRWYQRNVDVHGRQSDIVAVGLKVAGRRDEQTLMKYFVLANFEGAPLLLNPTTCGWLNIEPGQYRDTSRDEPVREPTIVSVAAMPFVSQVLNVAMVELILGGFPDDIALSAVQMMTVIAVPVGEPPQIDAGLLRALGGGAVDARGFTGLRVYRAGGGPEGQLLWVTASRSLHGAALALPPVSEVSDSFPVDDQCFWRGRPVDHHLEINQARSNNQLLLLNVQIVSKREEEGVAADVLAAFPSHRSTNPNKVWLQLQFIEQRGQQVFSVVLPVVNDMGCVQVRLCHDRRGVHVQRDQQLVAVAGAAAQQSAAAPVRATAAGASASGGAAAASVQQQAPVAGSVMRQAVGAEAAPVVERAAGVRRIEAQQPAQAVVEEVQRPVAVQVTGQRYIAGVQEPSMAWQALWLELNRQTVSLGVENPVQRDLWRHNSSLTPLQEWLAVYQGTEAQRGKAPATNSNSTVAGPSSASGSAQQVPGVSYADVVAAVPDEWHRVGVNSRPVPSTAAQRVEAAIPVDTTPSATYYEGVEVRRCGKGEPFQPAIMGQLAHGDTTLLSVRIADKIDPFVTPGFIAGTATMVVEMQQTGSKSFYCDAKVGRRGVMGDADILVAAVHDLEKLGFKADIFVPSEMTGDEGAGGPRAVSTSPGRAADISMASPGRAADISLASPVRQQRGASAADELMELGNAARDIRVARQGKNQRVFEVDRLLVGEDRPAIKMRQYIKRVTDLGIPVENVLGDISRDAISFLDLAKLRMPEPYSGQAADLVHFLVTLVETVVPNAGQHLTIHEGQLCARYLKQALNGNTKAVMDVFGRGWAGGAGAGQWARMVGWLVKEILNVGDQQEHLARLRLLTQAPNETTRQYCEKLQREVTVVGVEHHTVDLANCFFQGMRASAAKTTVTGIRHQREAAGEQYTLPALFEDLELLGRSEEHGGAAQSHAGNDARGRRVAPVAAAVNAGAGGGRGGGNAVRGGFGGGRGNFQQSQQPQMANGNQRGSHQQQNFQQRGGYQQQGAQRGGYQQQGGNNGQRDGQRQQWVDGQRHQWADGQLRPQQAPVAAVLAIAGAAGQQQQVQQQAGNPAMQQQQGGAQPRRNNGIGGSGMMTCYTCGTRGHVSFQCPQRPQ